MSCFGNLNLTLNPLNRFTVAFSFQRVLTEKTKKKRSPTLDKSINIETKGNTKFDDVISSLSMIEILDILGGFMLNIS